MIEPTLKDIGREVIFRPIEASIQYGVITSFNDFCVFVKYGTSVTSQASFREDLFWIGEENDKD